MPLINFLSQEQLILDYLKKGNSITPLEALSLCNCWALSSRISDLKKKGYNIQTTLIKDKTNKKIYASYKLIQQEKQMVFV